MSWGCSDKIKCMNCKKEYILENDTFSNNYLSLWEHCPECGGEVEVVERFSALLEGMRKQKELFENSKKRCNL